MASIDGLHFMESLSLQNTLIGVSFMEHTVHPFERNNAVDFRTTVVAVDLRTFSSPPKGNPVPSAVSSDPPFRPAPCGPNQARSHACLGRFGPSRTLRATGLVCYAVSFLPRLHLGEDREIPGVTTSAGASQMWPYSIISCKVIPIN